MATSSRSNARQGPALHDLVRSGAGDFRRLTGMFLRDANGRRPVYGGTAKFQEDPHWRDLILFYEYFHGDNGEGLGASHQTGWTGLVAFFLDLFGRLDAKTLLETERGKVLAKLIREQVGGEKTGKK